MKVRKVCVWGGEVLLIRPLLQYLRGMCRGAVCHSEVPTWDTQYTLRSTLWWNKKRFSDTKKNIPERVTSSTAQRSTAKGVINQRKQVQATIHTLSVQAINGGQTEGPRASLCSQGGGGGIPNPGFQGRNEVGLSSGEGPLERGRSSMNPQESHGFAMLCLKALRCLQGHPMLGYPIPGSLCPHSVGCPLRLVAASCPGAHPVPGDSGH